jgi:predicted ATPase/serine/threonine protein kinase
MERERWGQVEQIFHAALQVEESRRGELVRQSCAGDEDLRREVESLLAHHSESVSFIETPAFADAGASPLRPRSSRSLNPALNPKSGLADTVIGHYRILGKIGCGGMGVVYEAEDLKLGRHVALKFLPEELAEDPESLQRFRREARSASALNHPNICTVYEVDEANGRAFIAMELVEGKTLRELLVSGSLPMRKAIEIAAQVAEGLTKAHEAGIAHRDLKPENLMVSDDGFVKILDFGLAKLAPISGEQPDMCITSASQTQVGLVLGTVGYMSPEQASGDRLDFRSDQFSFGLVLYEMVTGKRAFQRSTAAETLVAILREPPEPITRQNRDAPAPLCWAIERCLAKEPDKRYVSTRDLARELTTIRDRFSEKPLQQVEARPANLPVQRTGFVGREKEVAAVKELLLRQDVRLLTVTGPGGIGKTRLAVEVANGLVESFPGGTHFVPLSSLSDPGLIASVIVQALGIREVGGQSPLEILKKNLQESSRAPMLLLMDNFEHLVQAAPTVAELLATGPNLKIMVTSRAALHVYGEHEFPVPPLALPDPRSVPSVQVLLRCPAIALFVQRAAAAKPDFELNRENASAVAEICARLDGLPLAIELAAARVKVLSPSSMLTRLASRLQLLTGGSRDLPQRQQTLRAAMDWSYDLLDAAEQKLFRRLSVFVGGCTLEGAEAVCDPKGDLDLDLLDAVASLVDKSLAQQVERAKGESRFVMLETIREYALEKLKASGEGASTKRAHAAYCLVLAEEEATEQSGADGSEWLDRFASEHDNFRAALEWLTETGDAEWGLRLGTALFRYWEIREYLAEGRDRLGRLLKLAGAAAPTKLRMRALFAAGVLAGEQGDYASAEALINESQDIAHQLGDKTGIAVSLNALAVFARDRGDVATAQMLFEASLGLWRELGDQKAVARALSNLANVLKMQGDYDRARSLYAECLAIFRELEDRTGVAWSLNYQGDVARDQGDSAGAQALYEQGLVIFRELGDRWGLAGTLADLGSLAREQGNYPRGHSLYRESIKIFQELDHKRGIARLLECFACSEAAQLHAERSLRLAGAAAALRQNIGAPLTPAEQAKLEAGLHLARQALSNTEGVAAWLEGWTLPVEKVVEEVLMPDAASPSC